MLYVIYHLFHSKPLAPLGSLFPTQFDQLSYSASNPGLVKLLGFFSHCYYQITNKHKGWLKWSVYHYNIYGALSFYSNDKYVSVFFFFNFIDWHACLNVVQRFTSDIDQPKTSRILVGEEIPTRFSSPHNEDLWSISINYKTHGNMTSW